MRCEDFSGLLVRDCGHCQGIKLDPELEEVARTNLQQSLVTTP